jgi:beta-lactamase regulating signal transducer with metallopeptidase domain
MGGYIMNSCITFLNSVGKTFVEFAGPMLIQSSVLIIVLLALDFVLRKKVRAGIRYSIWMLVLIKLLLPVTLSSPTGLGYWVGDKLPTSTLPNKIETVEMESIAEPVTVETTFEAAPSIVAAPQTPIASPVETTITPEPTPSLTWQGIALLAWFAAVTSMTLLLLQRMFFVRGLIAQATTASTKVADIFEQCKNQLCAKTNISMKLTSTIASPSVCGLFRPTILIPQKLLAKLDSRNLKSIFLHELAHIKRGDLWISLLQTTLQIIYFYNPLLWIANATIRKVREQAVDETVLAAMGEQANDYPETLLNISKLAFTRPALSLRLIGVVESKKALTSRIKHILGRPFPKTARLGLVGFLSIILAAAILLPMAKSTSPPEIDVDLTVTPLVGIGSVKFGMSKAEVIAVIGKPEKIQDNGASFIYYSKGMSIGFGKISGVNNFNCYTKKAVWPALLKVRDFVGSTEQGIKMGSTENEIVAAFGTPKKRVVDGAQVTLEYKDIGLHFILLKDKLLQFGMMKTPLSPPTKQSNKKTESTKSTIPQEFVGHWKGQAKIIVNWTRQRWLAIEIEIMPDGKVTGKVGDSELKDAVFKSNRGWLGKKLNIKTDWIIRGDLIGPVIKNENIEREYINLLFMDLDADGKIKGGFHTSGTHIGTKKSMVMSGMDMVLKKISQDKLQN